MVSPGTAPSLPASIDVVHPSSGFTVKRLHRMEIEHLQRLREANQDLLQRLRVKQEELRKRLRSKASLDNRTAPESSVPLPTRRVCVVSVLEVLGSKWTFSEKQQLCLWSDAVKEADGLGGAGRK